MGQFPNDLQKEKGRLKEKETTSNDQRLLLLLLIRVAENR
jgi:hypothetical protein